MSNRHKLCHLSLLLICHAPLALPLSAEESPQTGAVEGRLLDAAGQAAHVGQAVVLLCDGSSGMPLSAQKRAPLAPGAEVFNPSDSFWHALTDERGGFEFKDVPPGAYRLVAQSWAGVAGMPRLLHKSHRDDPGVEPSSVIVLLGVAEGVEVRPGETAQAHPRQWGDQVLHLVTDPQEPHNFVLFSHSPPLGDSVLGPAGWGPTFLSGIVGATRMEDSRLTVIGLPNDAPVHVRLLNYDNSVGLGGGSYTAGSGRPERLPIYASWSNGLDEPPAHLQALTAHLEQAEVDLAKLIGGPRTELSVQEAWERAAELVELEGYGEVKLLDLLAADSYRQLRKHHRQQRERRNR